MDRLVAKTPAARIALHTDHQPIADLSECANRPGLSAAAELRRAPATARLLSSNSAPRPIKHSARRLVVTGLEDLFGQLAVDVDSDFAGLGARLCQRRHSRRAALDGPVSHGV